MTINPETMNSQNISGKIVFIIGAILLIIASFMKVNNIGIANYILASGITLMVTAAVVLYLKFR